MQHYFFTSLSPEKNNIYLQLHCSSMECLTNTVYSCNIRPSQNQIFFSQILFSLFSALCHVNSVADFLKYKLYCRLKSDTICWKCMTSFKRLSKELLSIQCIDKSVAGFDSLRAGLCFCGQLSSFERISLFCNWSGQSMTDKDSWKSLNIPVFVSDCTFAKNDVLFIIYALKTPSLTTNKSL